MLWPLVLFVLAATIEAGDVTSPKGAGGGAGKAAKRVKPVSKPVRPPSVVLERASNAVVGDDSIDFNLINGTEADIDEFPFYAMLSKRDYIDETVAKGSPIKLLCGSSLVHPKFLISAWHCFKKNQDPKHVVAVFHITNRCKPDVNNIAWHELQKIHFYPGSITNRKNKRHDLVLIELVHEVTDVSPLIMPSQPPTVGTVGTIIGFGRTAWSKTKIDDQVPCTLRKTFETVEAWEKCRHPGERVVGSFCGVATTTTACRGDSGGPWLTWNNGAYELQGVVSFGSVQCDAKHANDHYTNVVAYKDWIFATIRAALMVKNQANKTSSAILERNELGRELGVRVNAFEHETEELKYTARDPVFPQYLYKPKNVTRENVQSQLSSGSPQRWHQPVHVQTLPSSQWPQPQQLQPPSSQWLQPQQLQTPPSSQWLQPQQLQTPPASQWLQPLQLQTPQQLPFWDMQQLQFYLLCYGPANPPPVCFPQINQQSSYSNQPLEQTQPFKLQQQQQQSQQLGLTISLGRSVPSGTSSAASPVDTKSKSSSLHHHK